MYISVRTEKGILQDLLSAPPSHRRSSWPVLSTVNYGLQTSCDTAYSPNGVNQMWILKNSKDLLKSLSSQSLSVKTSIKTWFFNSLYHYTAS